MFFKVTLQSHGDTEKYCQRNKGLGCGGPFRWAFALIASFIGI